MGNRVIAPDKLNSVMEFGHVIRVHADGTVSEPSDVYCPVESLTHDETDMPGSWSLMNGYSGQQGYSGPHMHSSEFIGGRMARDILCTPGFYVALIVVDDPEDSAPAWAVAYSPDDETEDCPNCSIGLCPTHEAEEFAREIL